MTTRLPETDAYELFTTFHSEGVNVTTSVKLAIKMCNLISINGDEAHWNKVKKELSDGYTNRTPRKIRN